MTDRKPSTPSRGGWQVATAVLVLLASVACAGHASAAAAPGTLGAGSVYALAIDPRTGTALYAGTYCGSLMESTDSGGTWSAAHTGLTTATVLNLAIDPATPSTLYATTYYDGVFKSTDSGATWSTANAGLTSLRVRAVAIDPTTPNTLYVGSEAGVFRSTDAAVTWRVANTGLPTTSVFALAVDPTTPTTLYAGTYGSGVFKSTNGGHSWDAAGMDLAIAYILALAIDPTTPSTLYTVPALCRSDSCLSLGVYKSTDGGATWNAANAGLTMTAAYALAIDPSTPSTLYAATQSDGVFKSTDSGGTWNAANTGLMDTYILTLAIDPTTPNTVYAGTHSGGVFKSTDAGATWSATGLRGEAICGDGLRCGEEECDDGNTSNTDACRNDCTRNVCGDGFLNPAAEECDDGNRNNDDGCTNNCTICGNGKVTPPEQCDDGNTSNTDACRNDCTWNVCGDGLLNPVAEQCDDGNQNSNDGCTNYCTICGNGTKVTPFEECDDGNLVDADGCESDCMLPRCGNGILDAGEECDAGFGNSSGVRCTNDCTICGNGITTPPEACDDGNRNSNDACTNACFPNVCGDGFVNRSTEECDDGNGVNGDECDVNCTLPRCGNGIVDPAEECDDGNASNTDVCRNDCRRNVCGDGFLNPAVEQCDDGNRVNADGCEHDCLLPRCGDGNLDAGEQCDDGNRNPFDGCTNGCTICGDGIVTPPEECDDGNTNTADGCTNACTRCGNGVVTGSEACDDGNLMNGDGCDADCASVVCGNGRLDPGEECDDGGVCIGGANAGTLCTADVQCSGGACTTFGGDGCAANCTTESEVTLNLVPGVADGLEIPPGTSGLVFVSDFVSFPLPFGGVCHGGDNANQPCTSDDDCPGGTCVRSHETLTIGKARDGHIPVVIKATAVHLARMPISTLGCLCPRAVAAKTCGGTLFEPDGVTQSPDCTAGFTVGESVCDGKPPCTFVHGPGNSAAGLIGCDGLDGVNINLTQDSGGSNYIAHPPLLTISGSGAGGSAVLSAHTAIGGLSIYCSEGCFFPPGLCTGSDPSLYGPDGEFCTDDDPQDWRGKVFGRLVTTGTASVAVLNANGSDGQTLPADGPLIATGHPFSCSLLADGSAAGAALASVALSIHEDYIGDSVTTTLLAAAPPPFCVGDCHGDGQVGIADLLAVVNLALGTAQPSACPDGVPSGAGGSVALIIQAVNHALDGCGN